MQAVMKKTPKGKAKSAAKKCHAPRYGGKCAKCGRGKLDYNGLLQLMCPVCGHVADAGSFS
jgi:rubrerythrin